MQRTGTLTWLLAAVCLSGEPTIQTVTGAGASTTTPAVTSSELNVATDSNELGTTTAAESTTTATISAFESTVTIDDAADIGNGRFCNRTISYTVKTDCKPCLINAAHGCPDGLVQLTQVSTHALCTCMPVVITIICHQSQLTTVSSSRGKRTYHVKTNQ